MQTFHASTVAALALNLISVQHRCIQLLPGSITRRRPAVWARQALATLAAVLGCLVGTAAASGGQATAADSTLPDARLFFATPDFEQIALSPSGRYLAFTSARGSPRVSLIVIDLQSDKPPVVPARFADADIGDVRWVNDEMLVFDIDDRNRGGGDQRWWPGLYSVHRDGSGLRLLVDIDMRFVVQRPAAAHQPLPANHRLLHVPRGDGREVIVGEWQFSRTGEASAVIAKRLDVVSGRSRSLSFGAPENVMSWWFDADGQPRLVATRNGKAAAYHWRDAADKPWRLLAEFDALLAPWMPRQIDADGNLYVTVASGADGAHELRRFDFATGKPQPEALVKTPGFDFSGQIVSETPGSRALGVRVLTDAETTIWFDKRLQALQRAADERFPGTVNRISCRRCDNDDMAALVNSWSDREPGQVWLYRAADQSWRAIAKVRPEIDARQMATTDFFRIRTRDGTEIPVWITTPPGKAEAPRPAVVLVHGGPWVRGRQWNWSAHAQFLASRGYVVIEPEFRGSTGYGRTLFRAGWKKWGTAMQDDLVDALDFAAGKGFVDKDRVCIAGASYGGYATLMSLVRHPAVYRCGVAWVAVSDPRLMMKWQYGTDVANEAREYDLPLLIGDPVADKAMLDAATPVLHASRIKAPVLLAMGGADRRVPLEHGTRMRDALKEAGNPPLWKEYADEGHGFFLLDNRLDFMRQVERFLAEHLAPRR
ncbi:alpha/beta hydrolase family protein [Piscinibacter sakaiensis]|uniref:alpha/beta hydrolase family protein n=1 Tax=Piscinibacter sakaiensis TaxID=1547922 RepID=UPI003AAC7B38